MDGGEAATGAATDVEGLDEGGGEAEDDGGVVGAEVAGGGDDDDDDEVGGSFGRYALRLAKTL